MMVICAVLWSTSGVVMKYIDWSPFLIGGGRAIFSTTIVGISVYISGYKLKVTKKCVCSAAASFINVVLYIAGNKLTTAANSIVLQYTAPIFILVITAFVLKKKLKKIEVSMILLATFGIILFFMDKLDTNGMVGNILSVLSGLFLAIMMVLNGIIEDDGERMTGILLGHGSLALIGTPIGLMLTDSANITTFPILLVVYLGVFQMGLSYVIYGRVAGKISPVAASLISMIEPMLNPVLVALIYGEIPGFWAIIGAIIIILAVVIYTIFDGKEDEENTDKNITGGNNAAGNDAGGSNADGNNVVGNNADESGSLNG